MTERNAVATPISRADGPLLRLVRRQEFTLFCVVVVFALLIGLLNPVFFSPTNLVDLLRSSVVYFIVACGLTIVMVAGGLDFSVGATFTLGGVSAAWMMSLGVPWPLALVAGLALGGVVGVVNAEVIDRLQVPPIITTLGTFYVVTGLVIVFTGGRDISPLPPEFNALGKGTVLGIPNLIIYAIVIGIAFDLVLRRTRIGYDVRAVGGSRRAAVANGISATRINLIVYTVGGAAAALGGIFYAARTGSGQVAAGGATITLAAISAVLIGGTSLFGGTGTILGTALGTLLFAVFDNGLAIADVPPNYSSVIVGTVLIAAVAVDSYRRRRSLQRIRQRTG